MKRAIAILGIIFGLILLAAVIVFVLPVIRPGMELPALTPTSDPTLRPTPTPKTLPSQAAPLPPGLKLIYAETDGVNGTTNIWLANPTDIVKQRKLLATLTHKPGYEVRGQVSPDGSKIAYLVIPPDTSETAARLMGGQVWVMNSDGSKPQMIANQMGYLGMWSPDSQSITTGRWTPGENTGTSGAGLLKEIYLVNTDTSEMKLLVSDEKSSDVQPAGWSGDGQVFYHVVRPTLTSPWQLWATNIANGSTYLQISSPVETNDLPVLSPDGNWLLFTADKAGQRTLIALSMDGKQQKTLAQAGSGESTNPLTGIWSANSQRFLLSAAPEMDRQFNLELINLNDMQKTNLPIRSVAGEQGYFVLLSWSPGQDWVIVSAYPTQPQSTLYAINLKAGQAVKLPLTSTSNWLIPFGWVNR